MPALAIIQTGFRMVHAYRFGVEEEYFLASASTRNTQKRPPRAFLAACEAAFPDAVKPEMLQSQIEVATPPCDSIADARAALASYRAGLAGIARRHDLLVFAAGTHPIALWSAQNQTDDMRYDRLMRDLQMLGSRNLVCGLHVHVEPAAVERRVELMNRVMPFVPLLLALSTSSPFWQARRTGLLGYRLSAYRELPRTGVPQAFDDTADYDRFISVMTRAGAIRDASFCWWVVRPSLRHPTLELRVADSCTRLDDALSIAALFRCLVRRLERDPDLHATTSGATRAITVENIWRAQRYGVHGALIDEKRGEARSVSDVIDDVADLLDDDARALGCRDALSHARSLARTGASADAQLAIYHEARGRCPDRRTALADVVDWLAATTEGQTH